MAFTSLALNVSRRDVSVRTRSRETTTTTPQRRRLSFRLCASRLFAGIEPGIWQSAANSFFVMPARPENDFRPTRRMTVPFGARLTVLDEF